MRIVKTETHDLKARVLEYAARVVRLSCALPPSSEAQMIKNQLFRSGTSVGAHVAEANRGKSRADFVSKLEGALQELEETKYWMELLIVLKLVEVSRLDALMQETDEITAILVAMVSRSRKNQ
jgi:four helix bundle protein